MGVPSVGVAPGLHPIEECLGSHRSWGLQVMFLGSSDGAKVKERYAFSEDLESFSFQDQKKKRKKKRRNKKPSTSSSSLAADKGELGNEPSRGLAADKPRPDMSKDRAGDGAGPSTHKRKRAVA